MQALGPGRAEGRVYITRHRLKRSHFAVTTRDAQSPKMLSELPEQSKDVKGFKNLCVRTHRSHLFPPGEFSFCRPNGGEDIKRSFLRSSFPQPVTSLAPAGLLRSRPLSLNERVISDRRFVPEEGETWPTAPTPPTVVNLGKILGLRGTCQMGCAKGTLSGVLGT